VTAPSPENLKTLFQFVFKVNCYLGVVWCVWWPGPEMSVDCVSVTQRTDRWCRARHIALADQSLSDLEEAFSSTPQQAAVLSLAALPFNLLYVSLFFLVLRVQLDK
jgi:hypothetical protein